MSLATFQEAVVDTFGGLNLRMKGADLPLGVASDALNIEHLPSRAGTRPGCALWRTYGDDGINGLFPYVTVTGERRVLGLSESGVLWDQGMTGARRILASGLEAGLRLKVAKLFGRLYICLSDGFRGRVPPFQYDPVGNVLDRLTTTGPVQIPTVANSLNAGSIPAGRHYLREVWETRNRALVPSSQGSFWDAAGGVKAVVSGLAVPPAWVSRKHFYASAVTVVGEPPVDLWRVHTLEDPAAVGPFDIDFSDARLRSLPAFSDVENCVELAPQLGVEAFGDERLVFWGGETSIFDEIGASRGLLNMHFDASSLALLGWDTVTAGCSVVADGGARNVLKITGSGKIRQQRLNPPAFKAGVKYSWAIRARRDPAAASGSISVRFQNQVTATIPVASLSERWDTYEALAINGTVLLTTDLVEVSGTAVPAGGAFVDLVRVFPTNEARRGSLVYVSDLGLPENVQGDFGALVFKPDDGQDVKACIDDDGVLLVAKETTLFATMDDGIGDPASWNRRVTAVGAGAASPTAFARGPGWTIVAGRRGVWRVQGGAADLVSGEIEPLWNSIDWAEAGAFIWATVDAQRERVYIGVPLDGGKEPALLVVDYHEGWNDARAGGGVGRHWERWTVPGTCGGILDDETQASRLLVGVSLSARNEVASSEAYSFGPWTPPQAPTPPPTVTTGIADPLGGTGGGQWAFAGGATSVITLPTGYSATTGSYVTASAWFRAPSGLPGTLQFGLSAGAQQVLVSVPAATDWTGATVVTLGPVAATSSVSLVVSAPAGATVEAFGFGLQAGRYFLGHVRTTGSARSAVSGSVVELTREPAVQRHDMWGDIESSYTTGSFGPAGSGRILVAAVTAKIEGAGTLQTTLLHPDGSEASLAARTLEPSPEHDIEIHADEPGSALRVRIGTNGHDEWFSLGRLGVFLKRKPFDELREV